MARRLFFLLGLMALLGLYVSIAYQVQTLPRRSDAGSLQVALPGFVQVLFAGGDRHLAANLNVMRSMMVSGDVTDPDVYGTQAKLQLQTSILNPYHEDNYYIAAAILAWEGQAGTAQLILERATDYRDWDFLAPFFAGFNRYHFFRDGVAAGQLANRAADRLEGDQALAMRDIAARWVGTDDDLDQSVRVLQGMAQSTRDPRMQRRLAQRIERVQQLQQLRLAASRYRQQYGSAPDSLEVLLETGLLERLPEDPLRKGFVLDANGEPQFNTRRQRSQS